MRRSTIATIGRISLCLLFFQPSESTVATKFVRVCSTSEEVFAISSDNDGTFVFLDIEDVLRESLNIHRSQPLPPVNTETLEAITSNSTNVFWVRTCPCSARQTMYCPISMNTCGVPGDLRKSIGCFNMDAQKDLMLHGWPLLLLWYGTLCFFFLFTERGNHARRYIFSLFGHRGTQDTRTIERILYTGSFINGTVHLNPQILMIDPSTISTQEEPRPTELVLKTKLYQSEHPEQSGNDLDHSDDKGKDKSDMDCEENSESVEASCTICFSSINNGDRVGALACKHYFHVECLKDWLKRRNVCPLCQCTNAADPRFSADSSSTEGDSLDRDSIDRDIDV